MRRVRKQRTIIRASATAVMLLTAGSTPAVEKYWIAHEASLIVVGTLHPHRTFPWFDGWHMSGTIDVEEVLFGERPVGPIDFHVVCGRLMCDRWPPPRFTGFFTEKGMWFLRPLGARSWQPSDGMGFVALAARADFEAYIRRYKQRADSLK